MAVVIRLKSVGTKKKIKHRNGSLSLGNLREWRETEEREEAREKSFFFGGEKRRKKNIKSELFRN